MDVQFLFSSPEGDIPLGAGELERPFLITPAEEHPDLTVGGYFEAIRDFVLGFAGGEPAAGLPGPEQAGTILIRSEKHGALYHIASVELITEAGREKLVVTSALSVKAQETLTREYQVLRDLHAAFGLPYLPRMDRLGRVEGRGRGGSTTLVMALGEWLEGFHEWHYSVDKSDGRRKICIWETGCGNRFLGGIQAREVFRQAARILALYYDYRTGAQIYPWHHAAGDFVVRERRGKVEVRLVTARGYGPIMELGPDEEAKPITALVYFFLNVVLKMRLDKLDGVGEPVWSEDFAVGAAVSGVAAGLREMEEAGKSRAGAAAELFSLLRSFERAELMELHRPLLDLYWQEDPDDLLLIQAKLGAHCDQLYRSLKNFCLGEA